MNAQFLSPLRVEEVDDHSNDGRGTWRLIDPLIYQSDAAERTIVVPKDFLTDFASVPRIPVAFLLCGDIGHAAAVVHDFLYTVQIVPRIVADAVLREAAELCGVPAWRSELMYLGVRIGGASRWAEPGQDQLPHVVATLSGSL